MVGDSGAGEGRLVLDLGAGYGAVTAALAGTGARVIAVERDPRLAGRLSRRFDGDPRVRVVEADVREVPLPRRDFLVVANIPFGVTTDLLRRLLGDPGVRLAGAEMIIAWGAARWLTARVPRDEETAWWTARYSVRLAARIAPGSFSPPPSVAAARVSIRPYGITSSSGGQRRLRAVLRAGFRQRDRPVSVSRRMLLRAGIDPATPVAAVTARQWNRLAGLLMLPVAAGVGAGRGVRERTGLAGRTGVVRVVHE
jgi:16S rRNA A1518/A1519 N6-dimethyltransferase RsmA/KsgA/DIM1 with predicted DNA glycosylase/AP lyase activity